ncbi:DnaJ domain-containing protein, putative, partial [Eimeria acervulina]
MLHPDKNKAPKAEDAFKKVNKVSATLLDPQQRRAYDLGGVEAVEAPQQTTRRNNAAEFMTAESVRDFSRSTPGRGHRGPQQHYQENNLHAFVQFLPMLLLFLLMFLFNFAPHETNNSA